MKTRKTILSAIAGALLLASIPAAALADAPDQAETCVEFDTRFVRTKTAETETKALPAPLPAGRYLVTIHTSDAYEGRSESDPALQDSERAEVLGIVTDDLADGVEAATVATTGTVDLAEAITSVTVRHAHGGAGWQSMIADAVCFVQVPAPPVTVPEPTVPEPTVPTPEPTEPTVPETTVPTVPETTVPTVPTPTVPETTVPTPDVDVDITIIVVELPEELEDLPVIHTPKFNG